MAKLGTFAEHSVAHEASLVPGDPDCAVLGVAALVSCGVTTGWGSAVYRAEVMPGDTVAVVGVGGVGINAVQGAEMVGAKYIVAVDPFWSSSRRQPSTSAPRSRKVHGGGAAHGHRADTGADG